MAYPGIVVVWAILCLTTVISSIAVTGGIPSPALSLAVLAAAFAKVYLVMHFFMELNATPLAWKIPFIIWTVGIFVVLSALLMMS